MPTSATTFNYDQNGNRTSSMSATSSTSLSWQSTSGRLVCVNTAGTSCSTTSPSATTTLYSYDGEGHRATSSTNSFIWDTGASQLLADPTHDYVYLQGSVSPDLQINLTTGTVDLLIQDQNANTRGVVQVTGANSSLNGTLVNYSDYDAYGNAITQSGESINPGAMSNRGVTTDTSTSFAFGAGYWDSSNLTYLVHRYLDNETGQFISVDPLVDQTREAYVYAGDGPVMAVDAMGLCNLLNINPFDANGCLGDATSSVASTAVSMAVNTYHMAGMAFDFALSTVYRFGDFIANATNVMNRINAKILRVGTAWVSKHWRGVVSAVELGAAVACTFFSAGACAVVAGAIWAVDSIVAAHDARWRWSANLIKEVAFAAVKAALLAIPGMTAEKGIALSSNAGQQAFSRLQQAYIRILTGGPGYVDQVVSHR